MMSSGRSIGVVLGVVGAVVALAACGSEGPSDTSGAVAVEEAWVREPAAGQTTVAVYATVVNGTDHEVTLRRRDEPAVRGRVGPRDRDRRRWDDVDGRA